MRSITLLPFAISLAAAAPHPIRRWDASSLPATGDTTVLPHPNPGFLTARGGKLYVGDELWTFATLNSPHLLTSDEFEVNDTFATLSAFGRPVTRTYTLGVTSVNIANASAHINGWDDAAGDWIYNEDKFVQTDMVFDTARQWGAKLIIPVINQDYGSPSSNYNGDWSDLIRFRYGLDSYNATKSINFWTDPTMIDGYKLILKKFLTRQNTINGRVYGQDDTLAMVESGNEMNYNMTPGADTTRPPPGSWTVTAAEYVKSLAPNVLFLDGSLARNNFTEQSFAPEALASSAVDVFSSHYYRNNPVAYDYRRITNDSTYINSYGKTFIVGEHGFYNETSQWDDFYRLLESTPTAGAMVWGLRPHSSAGGFLTHGEGDGIYSYHAPGWSPAPAPEFDPLELPVIRKTYDASFAVVSEDVPQYYPVPLAPALNVTDTSNGTTISLIGGAWADFYQIWSTSNGNGWEEYINIFYDNKQAGNVNFTLPNGQGGDYAAKGVSVDLKEGPWSNVITI